MKESLARVHVHELPLAANDNRELAPETQVLAANDNEVDPVMVAPETAQALQQLSETRARLGLVEAPTTAEELEETATPEELPQLTPEHVGEIGQISPESIAAYSSAESSSEGGEARTAQAAGGASGAEGGMGTSGGSTSGGDIERAPTESGKKGRFKVLGALWKTLKFALWLPFATFALAMDAVIKTTGKALDWSKLSKGGGGSKPSGGGGGSHGGGGGHH